VLLRLVLLCLLFLLGVAPAWALTPEQALRIASGDSDARIAALNADDYINHLPYTYGPAWLLATGLLLLLLDAVTRATWLRTVPAT